LPGNWSLALSQPYFTTLSISSKKIPCMKSSKLKVSYCNMRFHWNNIGLGCLMYIHENEILLVKFPAV